MKHSILGGVGAFVGGIVFAVGLGVSGMLEPKKIIGFLDLFGEWDPSLLFVMCGAVGIHMALYRLIIRRKSPLFDVQFHLPKTKSLDRHLVIGSLVFGAGWAVSGLCPGPGVVSFVTGNSYALVFVGSMLAGIFLSRVFAK